MAHGMMPASNRMRFVGKRDAPRPVGIAYKPLHTLCTAHADRLRFGAGFPSAAEVVELVGFVRLILPGRAAVDIESGASVDTEPARGFEVRGRYLWRGISTKIKSRATRGGGARTTRAAPRTTFSLPRTTFVLRTTLFCLHTTSCPKVCSSTVLAVDGIISAQ